MDMDKIIEESNLVSENLLELLSQKLAENGVKVVEKYHTEGDAASEIIDETKAKGHNLIAVGSHGGGNLSRWLLGSVSTKVYEHAQKPVLIIKKK
jgi:nucleotide-binding universal stress UspA family protein